VETLLKHSNVHSVYSNNRIAFVLHPFYVLGPVLSRLPLLSGTLRFSTDSSFLPFLPRGSQVLMLSKSPPNAGR
jgi:hypothetical protein